MLEALILAVAIAPGASAFAAAAAPKPSPPPSLELLEFLGEFGDDEDGLFEAESGAPGGARRPVRSRVVPPPAPKSPAPSSPPRTAPKETA